LFIYRLIVLKWPANSSFYTAFNTTLLVSTTVLLQQSLWFLNCWFNYDSDDELQIYVRPFLDSDFPGEGQGHIGALYYNAEGLRISAVLTTMVFNTSMAVWTEAILYCCVQIVRFFRGYGVTSGSRKTYQMQFRMFRTLVLQMIVPMCCVYIPCAGIINYPIFFAASFFPNLAPTAVTLFPVMDAVITLFGVKQYR
ncbi:hypothetical protein PFISCL1PPCAC_22991, partial [Pristionchus fissidentatus]